jgi:ParB/RepB/Spo0J family partition protein
MTEEHDTLPAAISLAGAGPLMRPIPIGEIVSSPTNPRKHFSEDHLQELAESIKASGVHQPILVRPLPASRLESTYRARSFGETLPAYELIAGERRWRASKIAGLVEIPALIRPLTDAQVLEAQIVENLQRRDLSELEEAEGYELLMQQSGMDAEIIGSKIGKSRSYVYARMKLLALCPEAREAMRTGDIDFSRGLLIARIPDTKLQVKALTEATRKDGMHDVISLRTFQAWLQRNVMLHLDRARFNIVDAALVKGAPSCKECPKRTGADPDLFADVASADICIDPACFHAKEDAHRAVIVGKAEAKGMEVIDAKAAKAFVSAYSSEIKGYSRLDQLRHDVPDGEEPQTLRALLGDSLPNPVLIEHPFSGELIEAVPTEEAEAMLVNRGALQTTKKALGLKARITQIEAEGEHRKCRDFMDEAVKQVTEAVSSEPDPHRLLSPEFFREYLLSYIHYVLGPSETSRCLGIAEQDDDETLEAFENRALLHVQGYRNEDIFRAAVMTLFLETSFRFDRSNDPDVSPVVKVMAKALNVPLDRIKEEVTFRVDSEVAAKVQELKALAKPKNAEIATAPAARPEAGPGGGEKPRKGKKVAPAAAAPLSAEEAQQRIAAAMQELPAEPAGEAGGAMGKGVRVKVLANASKPVVKFIGQEGVIQHQCGPEAWWVQFTGQVKGAGGFHVTELAFVSGPVETPAPEPEISDPVDQAEAPHEAPLDDLEVGQLVRVKATATNKKWRGREGVLKARKTKDLTDRDPVWTVRQGVPPKHVDCTFFASDLELVEGGVA